MNVNWGPLWWQPHSDAATIGRYRPTARLREVGGAESRQRYRFVVPGRMVGVTAPDRPISRIDLRNRSLSAAQLRAALPRGGVDVDAVVPKVRPIIDAVAARGAEAALEYGASFDGVRPATVRVPAAELD